MKKITLHTFLISLVLMFAGCASNDDSTTEAEPEATANTTIPDQSNLPPEKRLRTDPTAKPAPPPGPEVEAVTFGRGTAKGNGMDVNFMHNVNRYKNGKADGEFKHSAVTQAGVIDIEVTVTCAELDIKSRKGWMGGKVTRNASTNPMYVSEVGADVWYRILDLGETELTAYISLPVFQQKGIKSAEAFCNKKPWSDEGLLKLDQGALAIFP